MVQEHHQYSIKKLQELVASNDHDVNNEKVTQLENKDGSLNSLILNEISARLDHLDNRLSKVEKKPKVKKPAKLADKVNE